MIFSASVLNGDTKKERMRDQAMSEIISFFLFYCFKAGNKSFEVVPMRQPASLDEGKASEVMDERRSSNTVVSCSSLLALKAV